MEALLSSSMSSLAQPQNTINQKKILAETGMAAIIRGDHNLWSNWATLLTQQWEYSKSLKVRWFLRSLHN